MVWLSLTQMRSTSWSSVRSSIWWSVERGLSWSQPSPLPTVPDSGEPMLTLRTVVSSGSVRMEKLTDMSVHQAWLTAQRATPVCGSVKFLSVASAPFPLMRLRSLFVLLTPLQELSPSTHILLTADSSSCVLEASQESRVAHWEKCLMLVSNNEERQHKTTTATT